MNFTLSDLVPPLRWNDPALLAELATETSVPAGWWRTLPLGHVMAALGAERVCDLLTHLTQNQWPAAALGDVLPPLHVVSPAERDWPTIAGTALRQAGSWVGILAVTANDLREMPAVGKDQAFAVIHTVFWEVIGRLPATGAEPLMPDLAPPVSVLAAWLPPSAPADVRAALNQLALVTGGAMAPEPEAQAVPDDDQADRAAHTGQLPAHRLPSAAPRAARDATARDAIGVAERPGLIPLINSAFADLDDLEWAIAQHRLFSDHPTDRRQLAKLFGVDTAHVSEAETRLRDRVFEWYRTPEAAPLAAHLAEMAAMLGIAAPVARLTTAHDWHQEELQALGVPVWRFLLPLLPDHNVTGEWLISGDPHELFSKTRELIVGDPLVENAAQLVTEIGIRAGDARAWLEATPGLLVRGGRVVHDSGYAVEAEASGDEPRLPAGPAGPARHEFVGIRRLIAKDIEEQGGEALLDDLADRLSQRFGLSPPLVARYAQGGEFDYDDGFVRLASKNGLAVDREPPPVNDTPRDVSVTHRCFQGKRGGRWWYRVDVTADLLHGDWAELPAGFAAYLGIEPGGSRTGRSPSGEIEFTWAERPLIRPVQPLLEALGAGPGDHVFLTLTSGGDLIYRHLRAPEDAISGVSMAVRLAGYTAPVESKEDAVRLIAARIDMPESPDRAELIARLHERGDADILEALG